MVNIELRQTLMIHHDIMISTLTTVDTSNTLPSASSAFETSLAKAPSNLKNVFSQMQTGQPQYKYKTVLRSINVNNYQWLLISLKR